MITHACTHLCTARDVITHLQNKKKNAINSPISSADPKEGEKSRARCCPALFIELSDDAVDRGIVTRRGYARRGDRTFPRWNPDDLFTRIALDAMHANPPMCRQPGSATNPDPRLIIVGSRSPIGPRDPLAGIDDRIVASQEEFNVKFQSRHTDMSSTPDLTRYISNLPNIKSQ